MPKLIVCKKNCQWNFFHFDTRVVLHWYDELLRHVTSSDVVDCLAANNTGSKNKYKGFYLEYQILPLQQFLCQLKLSWFHSPLAVCSSALRQLKGTVAVSTLLFLGELPSQFTSIHDPAGWMSKMIIVYMCCSDHNSIWRIKKLLVIMCSSWEFFLRRIGSLVQFLLICSTSWPSIPEAACTSRHCTSSMLRRCQSRVLSITWLQTSRAQAPPSQWSPRRTSNRNTRIASSALTATRCFGVMEPVGMAAV